VSAESGEPPIPDGWLRRVFQAGQDGKILRYLVREGRLTAEEVLALETQAEDQGVPARALLVGQGRLTAQELSSLEARLRQEDFLREPPQKRGPLPAEVEAVLGDESRRLAHFVLVEPLGQGGGGEVWRAWDRVLARWVAIKLAPAGSPLMQERFRREALAAARLQHPNLIQIHFVG
jgi:hypothetical protein